jgi:hypothetical protein
MVGWLFAARSTQTFGNSFCIVNRLLSCVVLLFVTGAVVYGQQSKSRFVRFNPSGEYHPSSGRPADDIFLQFHLQVRYKRGRRIAWGGIPTVAHFYRFKSVSVTEKHLRFSTKRRHGVRYDFEGSFLRRGNFTTALDIPGSLPLKGTLRKFVNGKKVMELTTSFVYYVGC